VAVFDGVYADIGDEQSIEQSLSTFSSHMTNIVNILSCVDSNSLVLFDELGAGTDPVEGAALAIAIIEKIRGVGAKVAATTHYSELKTFALSTDGVENGSCEFDVQTLRPTYKLLIGIPGKSNAFAISSKLGLSEDIIKAAKGKVAKENIQFEDILTDLETQRQEMEKQKNLAQFHAEEMERLRADLQKERDHYKATRENAIRQAKLEAGRIIEQAKFASEKAMEEIERLRKQKIDEEIQHKMSVSRSIIKGALNKVDLHKDDPDALRRPNIPYRKQKFHVGDTVTILNLNKTATVETLPDRNGNLTVVAGVMRVAVNERDIRIDNTMVKKDKNDQTGMKYIKNSTDRMNRTVKTEVDLRGMDGEQALVELEKYLDDAVVSGLHQVTIIHGKGTGVLRNVVQQRLKGHPHVKSFRLGKYGEGETGVTIAELK
jgi:DNA mismatch repair protein MutS2